VEAPADFNSRENAAPQASRSYSDSGVALRSAQGFDHGIKPIMKGYDNPVPGNLRR
jgi:hypothetical protein